ncbi:MAG TPA: winged helix-turn-helix transcriptional regulator [Sulfuricaulis sp.]|jgi:DNA-binding MarR family transcriptional regulator|nr:winged helix-turn-helix transcriptional regulator [Sulfuricaulis sp.]
MNTQTDKEEQLVLELLDAVGKQSNVSQRHLASNMGIALGLANSYLKRCIRKGFIKISEAPANRYLYYLTPKGFAEKSRLTTKYLSYSFAFYRQAGKSCIDVFNKCEMQGWRKILLYGMSDLAEIATLRAQERDVEVIGILDPHTERHRFAGVPVWHYLSQAAPYDVCVLTELNAPLLSYEQLLKEIDKERVLIPDILRLE